MIRKLGLAGIHYEESELLNSFIESNAGPTSEINSQLDLPDAMERYQYQSLYSKRPEKHVKADNDNDEEEGRLRANNMMNRQLYGRFQGDNSAVYKPEMLQRPITEKMFDETKEAQLKKEKRLTVLHAFGRVAQKDSVVNIINHEEKFKTSDHRLEFPTFARTTKPIQDETHHTMRFVKPRVGVNKQNYRTDVIADSDMLRVCADKTARRRDKGDKHRKNLYKVSSENEYIVNEKINHIYKELKKKQNDARLAPANLADDALPDPSQQSVQKDGRAFARKLGVERLYINEVRDLYAITEKINNVEREIKKSNPYVTLNRSLIFHKQYSDDTSEIDQVGGKPEITRRIGQSERERIDENEAPPDEDEIAVAGKSHHKRKAPHRFTELVVPIHHSEDETQFRDNPEKHSSALRAFRNELSGDDPNGEVDRFSRELPRNLHQADSMKFRVAGLSQPVIETTYEQTRSHLSTGKHMAKPQIGMRAEEHEPIMEKINSVSGKLPKRTNPTNYRPINLELPAVAERVIDEIGTLRKTAKFLANRPTIAMHNRNS